MQTPLNPITIPMSLNMSFARQICVEYISFLLIYLGNTKYPGGYNQYCQRSTNYLGEVVDQFRLKMWIDNNYSQT
uniref:Uncharacterized protein n=1 Tax=Glossina austeni TaxID=7395 RepID=A0A1A9UM18_GLOAU